jgi:tRNA/rRNA methyltransferase
MEHLETELARRGYFHPDHRTPVMQRTLRGILQRPGFTEAEVRTLRGVVKALCQPVKG